MKETRIEMEGKYEESEKRVKMRLRNAEGVWQILQAVFSESLLSITAYSLAPHISGHALRQQEVSLRFRH